MQSTLRVIHQWDSNDAILAFLPFARIGYPWSGNQSARLTYVCSTLSRDARGDRTCAVVPLDQVDRSAVRTLQDVPCPVRAMVKSQS